MQAGFGRGRTARWIVVLVASFAGIVSPGLAQRLHVHHYTEEDGLPSSTIWAIGQDETGRMWLATRGGLASYDGVRWEIAGARDAPALSEQLLSRRESDGALWSLLRRAPFKVFRLKGDAWHALPDAPAPRSLPAACLALVGDANSPLVAVGSSDGLFLWNGQAWRHLDAAVLPGSDVRGLATLGDRLVVGTTEGLAWLVEGRVTDLSRLLDDLPDRSVLALAASPDGESVWVVGGSWLGRLNRSGRFDIERRLDAPMEEQAFDRGLVAVADLHGGVYFGNVFALYYYHPREDLSRVDRQSGLSSGGVTALFRDREGSIWVGGMRGVTKIVSRRFLTFRAEHGLYEDEASAVLERRDGSYVVGHPFGLTLWDSGGFRKIPIRPGSSDETDRVRVLDMTEDWSGDLWIAASAAGLGRVRGGKLEWFRETFRDAEHVTSVHAGEDGALWVATGDGPLAVRTGSSFEAVELSRDDVYVRRFFVLPSHGMLVATGGGGIGRVDGRRLAGWIEGDTREANSVYALLERPDGSVWAGTDAGLLEIEGDRLVPVKESRAGIARPIYFLLEDGLGRVWAGTDHGVRRWDGESWRLYSVADGLAGRETNRAAGMLDRSGRVWIGTNSGLSIFREGWEISTPVPPLVQIRGLLAGGREHALSADLALGHPDSDLTFRFVVLSFVDEHRVTVRRRLEGLDTAWRDEPDPASRELRYPRLPPGRYRLQLQARSAEGALSETVSSPWITIARPLWQRSWVLALALVAILVLLYFVYRYFVQHRYARELEREVEEDLARAHRFETLAVFAGGLAHDFNNLLTVILGNLSVLRMKLRGTGMDPKPLDEADGAVKRAAQLTNQFLTFARGGAPIRKVRDVAAIGHESASLVLAGKSVTCDCDFAADLACADVDGGQIAQVFNNLLLNAAQAMPRGGALRFTGRNTDEAGSLPPGRYVKFSVSDRGPGIPADLQDRIFDPFFSTKQEGRGLGLSSAYSIVKRHGGMLSVESEPGQGATFHVFLPASDRRPEPPTDPPLNTDRGSGRVLVMDDDPAVRSVLSTMLEESGYRVVAAPEGGAAVEIYAVAYRRGEPFDAVILDLTVRDGMGGRETMEQLLAVDPEACAIVASGYSDDPVMAEHRRFGFRAALAKPIRRTELVLLLQQLAGETAGPSR